MAHENPQRTSPEKNDGVASTPHNHTQPSTQGKINKATHPAANDWSDICRTTTPRTLPSLHSVKGANSDIDKNVNENFDKILSDFLSQTKRNHTEANRKGAQKNNAAALTPRKNQTNQRTPRRYEEQPNHNNSNNSVIARINNYTEKNPRLNYTNSKTREVIPCKIQCVLQNCRKSITVNNEVAEYLRMSKNKEYTAFLTEPGLGKRFGAGQRTPRSLP